MLEGFRRQYPQIDIALVMQTLQTSEAYSNNPMEINVDVQGPNTESLNCQVGLSSRV